MYKNVANQYVIVYAVTTATGAPKTGEAANITAYIVKDNGSAVQTNDVNPTEIDATNFKGRYRFDLTQSETNADLVAISAVCSTSGVSLEPVDIYTKTPGVALEATLTDMKGAGYNNATDTLEKIRDAIDAVPSSTGMPTCYYPSSATRVTGTDEGGTVTDLAARDGVYYSTGEVNSSTLLEVTLTKSASAITEIPSLVQVHGRYEGGAGHIITASIWNFISLSWEQKGTMLSRTTDFDYTFSLNNNEEYHDAATGEMRFRFLHSAGTGITSHRLHLDYFCFQKQGTDSVLEANVAAIKAVTDNIAMTAYSGAYYVKSDVWLASGSTTPVSYWDAAISSRATPADILVTPANKLTTDASGNVTLKSGTHTGAVIPTVSTTGAVSGNVGGNVVGSVASVTGNVDGNVTGSVGSVATEVTAGTVTDKTGYSLTSDYDAAKTAIGADDILDPSAVPTRTWREALRLMFAMIIGERGGGGQIADPKTFKAPGGTKTRVSMVTDEDGNSLAPHTLDPS